MNQKILKKKKKSKICAEIYSPPKESSMPINVGQKCGRNIFVNIKKK